MEKTNYFELLTSKYGCRLVFVGPELKGKPDTAAPKSKFVTKLQDRPFFKVPVPNVAEKFFQYKEKCCGQTFHPENTLVFVFNGGFGNRMNRHGKNLKQPLLHSWLPDLKFLQEKNFVCGFTCADLPHDLVGETIVHSCMLGAKYVLSPMENPYHCASTYVGESSGSSAGSSRDGGPGDYCGNSYVYMTQGRRAAGKAEEKWLSTLLADNKLETTADLQAFFASVDEKFLHGRDVENMTKLPGVATAEKISFPVVEAAPAAATNKEKVGPPSPNVVSSPSSVAGQGSKEAPQQAPVVQGSGGAATSSKSKNKKKKQNAGSSNGDNKNAGAAEAASAAPAKDPTTDVSPPPAPAEGQNAKSSKKKSKAKAVAATPLEEEEPKKEQVLDPAAAEDAPKNITEESGGGGLSKGQKKRLAAKKKKEVSAPPARPAESDDTGEAMKSSIDAAQPAATSNKTAAEGAGAGPAAGGIQRHLEPPLLDIIGLRLEMVTKISPAVTSLQMETSPTDALVSARQARAERILDKINAAGACYFPLPGELAKVGCRLSEVEVSGGRGRARGSGEKEENEDRASSASSFLFGFDGSAFLREAAPSSSSFISIATTAEVEDPNPIKSADHDKCLGVWGDWQGKCGDDVSGTRTRSRTCHLSPTTTASTTTGYFQPGDHNVLELTVCGDNVRNAQSTSKPQVLVDGEAMTGYMPPARRGETGYSKVGHMLPGAKWTWDIKIPSPDSVIRLDWDSDDGVCISGVRVLSSKEEERREGGTKVLTKVPFWLDHPCKVPTFTGQQLFDNKRHDYYTDSGKEGQLRCWEDTREWGVGPRPEATTQQRALSLKTCGDSPKNWDGSMRVTLTMKDGRKLENTLKGKYHGETTHCSNPAPRQHLGAGLHQPGLETSLVFDPGDSHLGFDHDDSVQTSIAEEELDSVTLTMSGTCWAMCIEQVIYEADVLVQGAPFWLDDRKDSLPDCERLKAKGRTKCYSKTRTLQVSRARLELQFCPEQDQVAKLAIPEQGEARLQFRGTDEDEHEHETIKTVWKPTAPERLVTAFQRVPEKVDIVLDSEKSTLKKICILEVALGLHSHRVVLNKKKFFLDHGHKHMLLPVPVAEDPDAVPVAAVDEQDAEDFTVTEPCTTTTTPTIRTSAEHTENTVVEEQSLASCC
eukprot:g13335.t1